jgi:hypothetical protein
LESDWLCVFGFGSVFLGFAFIAVHAMIVTNTARSDITLMALAAYAQWLILAVFLYAVARAKYHPS